MNIRKSAGALLVPLALGTAGVGITDCYAAKRPNIINIMLDDLGFSDLKPFGSEIDTKNIQALADEGVILTNFYAAPTSTPGRAMLFTGKSSHAAGVGIMPVSSTPTEESIINKPEYQGRLSLDVPSFPRLLKDSGYYTMFTGKWDLSEIATVPVIATVPATAGQTPPAAFSDDADLTAQTAYLTAYGEYLTAYEEYFDTYKPSVVAPSPPKAPTEASLQDQYNNLLGTYNTLEEEHSAMEKIQMAAHDPFVRGFSITRAALVPGGGNHFSTNGLLGDTADPFTPWELVYPIGNPKNDNPDYLYTDNGVGITKFSEDFYSTAYYTKMAIEMLDGRDTDKPFYLCVSYTAPHNAVQAPAEETAKHIDTYRNKGWNTIRKERFKRQLDKGFWPRKTLEDLPPIPGDRGWENVPDGSDLLPATDTKAAGADPHGFSKNVYGGKDYSAKEMAAYAAMIAILDENIGKLIQHLKDIDEYDNTVIFLHADNGAGNGIFRDVSWAINTYENIGNRDSYVGVDTEWTITSNTPFTEQKASVKEGGWHTAAIIRHPKWNSKGKKVDLLTSVTDFAPMILDMAGVSYPSEWINPLTTETKQNKSMEGIVALKEKRSTAVVPLNGNFFVVGSNGITENKTERYLAFEIVGKVGLRKGDWKLVKDSCNAPVQLFNLADDPFETNDLAGTQTDKLQELTNWYSEYMAANNIIERTSYRGQACTKFFGGGSMQMQNHLDYLDYQLRP
ncbi:MAG: hypothetical protein D3915_02380 [Candidatus Electrothrix sp. AU1_5]|nr:hypothetical protein [Candidatus Electrothrix gigas]